MTTQIATLLLGPGDGAAAGAPGFLMQFGPILLMFGVIYLLLMRPASKQRKEHQALLSALKKDDEIVTQSGMYGRIMVLDEKVATLEISPKVQIKILRDRIAGRWNPQAASK
jgi:preprotein translocase subunit YajC